MKPLFNKAELAFLSAIVLLFLSALAAYVTINRLLESEKWVIHTYEMQAALGDIDTVVARAGRARSGFVVTHNASFLPEFEEAMPDIPLKIQRLKDLSSDNPKQSALAKRLEGVTNSRVKLLRQSIELQKKNPKDDAGQAELTRLGVPYATDVTNIMQSMREEEQQLLAFREENSRRLFLITVAILGLTFILAILLFSMHYRLLSAELKARKQAEQVARDSENSLRLLTNRLLQLQDEERRKFSRELHDSLGQYLAGVKMNLEMYVGSRSSEGLLQEAVQLLDQSIAETRTISHLLHPPLLDEAGLVPAIRWYVEGFAQRSGVAVQVDIPDDTIRLPKPLELGLFRVLQEGLTNIHRHSKSTKADIALKLTSGTASLLLRDYGKGIPAELLRTFRAKGSGVGVGLAGMQERVRELGGRMDIRSSGTGTAIFVTIPISENVLAAQVSAAT